MTPQTAKSILEKAKVGGITLPGCKHITKTQ